MGWAVLLPYQGQALPGSRERAAIEIEVLEIGLAKSVFQLRGIERRAGRCTGAGFLVISSEVVGDIAPRLSSSLAQEAPIDDENYGGRLLVKLCGSAVVSR